MEKGSSGPSCRAAICGIVVLLCAVAFSCSLAAEFRKVKVRLPSPAPRSSSRVPGSEGFVRVAGEGHEAGRQPLLAAQELRVRAGRRRHRLPLRGAARGHHGGGEHRVRHRAQEEAELRRPRPRRVRRPPDPLMVRIQKQMIVATGPGRA